MGNRKVKKRLITEAEVLASVARGAHTIPIDDETVITPSARDAAVHHRVEFSRGIPSGGLRKTVEPFVVTPPGDVHGPNATTIIALGSDHGGFQLKQVIKSYVGGMGYSIADVGTTSEEACDYPDFAYAVASLVASGQATRGIMIDAVGVASAIVANKVPGIRAVPCCSEFVARSSREHNDANVLTLGGRVLGAEVAKSIVKVWLETWFGGGRHLSRVQKIADIERKFGGPAK